MPDGILIIDWDEFEGGFVSYKYPDLEIPDNLVQLLQISHSFNPGLITIQEEDFHAISIGIEPLQKVIVLILEKWDDITHNWWRFQCWFHKYWFPFKWWVWDKIRLYWRAYKEEHED